LKLEQMYDLDESVPSTETKKKKRCHGFRYSTRKALDRSRESKAKAVGA
jgi:hypothetical protein